MKTLKNTKTAINTLCVIIISILTLSTILPGIAFAKGISDGFINNPESDRILETRTPVDVLVVKENTYDITPQVAVRMEKGEDIPAVIDRMRLLVPDDRFNSSLQWVNICIMLVIICTFIYLVIELIKFVVNINKGIIFESSNVKRIFRFGWCILLIATLQCAGGIIDDLMVSSIGRTSDGESLTTAWTIPWANFLVGTFALLLAQVWKMGLKMKAEQELTI